MIKVELEINGHKVKIQADNAQDIADAVKVLAEKAPVFIPAYPVYPYSPTSDSPFWPGYPIITCGDTWRVENKVL